MAKKIRYPQRPRFIRDFAHKAGRDYITSEDIQTAIDAGVPRLEIWGEVLEILGNVGGCGVEDSGCCAFVAWNFEKGTE